MKTKEVAFPSVTLIVLLTLCLTACHSTDSGPDAQLVAKAKAGDSAAQIAVGEKYFFGKGVKKDHRLAATWYRRAAEQGNARAQTTLGLMYLQGDGVPKDEAQGHNWIQRSADGGFPLAQRMLCSYFSAPENDALAANWCQKAAAQGDSVAEFMLGQMYSLGKGVARDFFQAAIWFRRSAEQGEADAQLILGHLYILGRGVKQDPEEAYFWIKLASLGRCELEKHEDVEKELAASRSVLLFWQAERVDKRVQDWIKAHPAPSTGG